MAYYRLSDAVAQASPDPGDSAPIVPHFDSPADAEYTLADALALTTSDSSSDTLHAILSAPQQSTQVETAATGHETPEPEAPQPLGATPPAAPGRGPEATPHVT